MFTRQNQIAGVDAFYSSRNKLFVAKGGDLLDVYDGITYKVRQEENVKASEIDMSPYCIVKYSDGQGFLKKEGTTFQKMPYSIYSTNIVGDKIAVYEYDYNLLSPVVNTYNIITQELSFDWKKSDSIVIIDDIVLFSEKESISWFETKTNKEVTLDISPWGRYKDQWGDDHLAHLEKTIGSSQKIIWLGITNHTVLGVDTLTGKVKYVERDVNNFASKWLPSAIPDPASIIVNSYNDKLIGFRWEFYWEIDCISGKIELTDLTQTFNAAQIRSDITDFALDNDNIFFLQYKPGKIGMFNITKKELTWQYTFDTGIIPNKIKYANQQVFVLDTNRTLHIFKKEN